MTKESKETLRLVIDVIIIPIATCAVIVLWDLNKSVGSLNTQVGTLIAQNTNLEKRVDKLEVKVFGAK